jgi:GNAT superfamily N-acetyltransferase
MSGLHIREAERADLDALAAFMRSQGSGGADADYLAHWYMHNPSGSASVVIGEMDGRIVGMATTNDHRFHRLGETALVAMPQKVLTDASVRGQGIFGKLYRAAEEACIARGADFFLTVTNAASTPIFLGRFGYTRLPSPPLAMLSALPGRSRLMPLQTLGSTAVPLPREAWTMQRSDDHRSWRYDRHLFPGYRVLSLDGEGPSRPTVCLCPVRRMGLPFLLLMDLWPTDAANSVLLLRHVRRLAWAERAVGVLLLEEAPLVPAIVAQWPRWRRSSGFNLLVKGRDEAHTDHLTRQQFELGFGDLDFF